MSRYKSTMRRLGLIFVPIYKPPYFHSVGIDYARGYEQWTRNGNEWVNKDDYHTNKKFLPKYSGKLYL